MSLYHDHYDLIHSQKDYSAEVETIVQAYRQTANTKFLGRVLDVGCGTGNHSLELAKQAAGVLGIDTDPPMVEKAQQKASCGAGKAKFLYTSVQELMDFGFDLTISMFNVVNYIETLPELLSFFAAIYRRLNHNGVFVFDVWNGTAVLRDPPKKEERNIQVGGITVTRKTIIQKIDPIVVGDTIHINNHCNVLQLPAAAGGQYVVDTNFDYVTIMRLWSKTILEEVALIAGFTTEFFKWYDLTVPADHDTWKLLGVCHKK